MTPLAVMAWTLGVWRIAAGMKWTSEFAITNRRVIVKTGLLARRTIEINISRVESVQVDQDIFGRLFNYGAITVIGTGGTKEPFTMIENPQAFRRMVQAEQG